MTFKIGGTDFSKYIAHDDGFKWSRNDIEAPDTGRTMDGLMHRGRVATKIRLDIKCRPLTSTELYTLLNAILPEYVTVEYTDPMYGSVTKSMYSNNNPATHALTMKDGTEWWSGISFPLVEQ